MSEHTINGKAVVVPTNTQKRIVENFRNIIRLKVRGNNLFFTDIDKIKQIMLCDISKNKSN